MMADMLASGVSGLLAFQRTLDTVSHNIANANTDGYSRQVVDLAARPANYFGGSYLGNGVDVAGVRRLYDQALTAQLRGANATLQQLDVYAAFADRLDKLFSEANTGVAASLQQFNNALETLATTPTSMAARQVVISQAQNLVNRLKSYQGSIDGMGAQIGAQLATEAQSINSMTRSIADLSRQIIAAQGGGQSQPNDLLDKRDLLISQLNERVGVTVVADGTGAVTVAIGNGQTLVVGTAASTLSVAQGDYDRGEQRMLLTNGTASIDVTAQLNGGRLGGLMQLRSDLLRPATNALGQIAAALADAGNQQHKAGLDLAGQLGADLFAIGAVASLPYTANAGSAMLTTTRTAIGALTTSDYQLRFDGGSWTVAQRDSGAAVTFSGAGTVASPMVFDGLSVVVSGVAQAGDSFLVQPTAQAVIGMRLLVTAPEKLAAAAPLLTGAAADNTGTGSINAGSVTSAAGWLRGNYTLSFTSTSNWQILDATNAVVATGAYVAGGNIDFNGMRVAVSGTPAAGDRFTINDNVNGKGDGRNARALIDTFDSRTLNAGTATLSDAVGNLVGRIGVSSGQAAVGRDAQSVLVDDATSAVQSVAGVNLDEEAANLVRFQQAYQAAARVIAVANQLFDELLNAVRA
jgi:flagellar hook-associated protein 1 FlgK